MIKLSIHAQQQSARRGLASSWIEATISFPDWTAADTDPALTHSFKAIEEFGGRILKVVHRQAGPDILVVTSYFDRDAKR